MIDSTEDIKKFSSETTDIKINEEYAKLVRPLTEDENRRLKESVEFYSGNYDPITLNPEGFILNGHHRYNACKELGIEPITQMRKFNSEIEEKIFVIRSNVEG
jgi:hypothetical protein